MGWETAFTLVNIVVLTSWTILIASPRYWSIAQAIPRVTAPLALSVAYGLLIISSYSQLAGAFSTFEAWSTIMKEPAIMLAGVLHIHAFNLFVGSWIATEADEIGLSRLAQTPILLLTLLFGPMGYVVFKIVRARYAKSLVYV